MNQNPPPNKGQKALPVGKPNCLTHKDGKGNTQPLIFVITGVLDSLEREECEALVKKYGGKVTGSISGKTNYLILGTDESGMPMQGGKATKAKSMPNCKIVDEDGFWDEGGRVFGSPLGCERFCREASGGRPNARGSFRVQI